MKTALHKKSDNPFKYWFWRAQISILRACPPLCGFVSDSTLGAQNSPMVWIKTSCRIAARMPQFVFFTLRDRWMKRVSLPRVTIVITMRCTLNCDKCAAHIPDLKNHADAPALELLADIRSLLSCVDHIYAVVISGGETFLHPDLDEIIRFLADSGKVGSISMATNGTVIPDAKVLTALREANVLVKISRYPPTLQPDVEKLKDILKTNGIRHAHESGAAWSDSGVFGQRKDGSQERRFKICAQQLCFPYMGGKLHRCGESAMLVEEGLIAGYEGDYIDLRAINPAAFRGQWRELLKRRSVSACSYCLGDTYQSPKVQPAVQREQA